MMIMKVGFQKTNLHSMKFHTVSELRNSFTVILPPPTVSEHHLTPLFLLPSQCQTMTISPWLEIRSRSRSRWTSISHPPSPGTVTSASPTVSCSRANVLLPRRVCPARRLRILHRATAQAHTRPLPSTRGHVLPLLQVTN